MDNTIKSVVDSLDGTDNELYPYLPYLLQDLWEIGASPEIVINLIRKHILHHNKTRILDLGCGKGAVSINIAKALHCQVHGIDALPQFINDAVKWAKKYNVADQCKFEVGDIRLILKLLNNYDVAILGSIGPVLGNVEQTLLKVKKCIKHNGHIILDDGYLADDSSISSNIYLKRPDIINQIQNSDMEIIDEYLISHDLIVESDAQIFNYIVKRTNELSQKHPDKKYLFDNYVKSQEKENDILENQIKCVTWLLKPKLCNFSD